MTCRILNDMSNFKWQVWYTNISINIGSVLFSYEVFSFELLKIKMDIRSTLSGKEYASSQLKKKTVYEKLAFWYCLYGELCNYGFQCSEGRSNRSWVPFLSSMLFIYFFFYVCFFYLQWWILDDINCMT